MKDPLTPNQLKAFEQGFLAQFRLKYDSALKSGAVDPDQIEDGDHTVAKIALRAAAETFGRLVTPEQKETEVNLRRFI